MVAISGYEKARKGWSISELKCKTTYPCPASGDGRWVSSRGKTKTLSKDTNAQKEDQLQLTDKMFVTFRI